MRSARGQLLAIALMALLGLSWSIDAPVLMWSGSNVFSGKNVQVQSTVSSNQLKQILSKIASLQADNLAANIAPVFSNEQTSPEVVVLYLQPSLRSDQVSSNKESLTRLKKEITSSKTSVVLPFVDFEESNFALVPEAIISVGKALPQNSKIVLVGSGRTHLANRLASEFAGLETLSVESLTSQHSIFTNGHLDVLVVELASDADTLAAKLEQNDELMDKIQDIVEDATNGKYVSVFTSQTVSAPAIQIDFGTSTEHVRVRNARAQEEDAPVAAAPMDVTAPSNMTSPSTNGTTPVIAKNPPNWSAYFPYWFWEGAVWLLVWGFLVLVAINSLMNLQTPTAFLQEKKKND